MTSRGTRLAKLDSALAEYHQSEPEMVWVLRTLTGIRRDLETVETAIKLMWAASPVDSAPEELSEAPESREEET